jgi:small-conductance mechanosensitive channel
MWNDLVQGIQSYVDAVGDTLSRAPPWAASLVILAALVVGAWILRAVGVAVLRRLSRENHPYIRSVVEQTKNPALFALLLVALAIALQTAPLAQDVRTLIVRLLVLGTICLIGWIALTAVNIGASLYLLRFRIDIEDNLMARKHVTQVRVLVRVLGTIIVLVTAGFALMTFDSVRQYGVSLFASAGVAGVIFGLAAQPVLSNLIAGVQLAVTQPIRLEDAVTVQNEYGWIEEINATYVVIRLWDLRRLIVPLNFFIQQPFYNWTREAANTIGSALIYLDYTAPIDLIRQKAIELVGKSGRPNTEVASVQITNLRPDCVELRVLIRSDSPGKASDASAELREKLISFLQREHPEALPRQRSQTVAAVSLSHAAPAEATTTTPAGRE